MRWPWQMWRRDRDADLRAAAQLEEAKRIRETTQANFRESQRIRERNTFGAGIIKAMGGRQ